LGCCATHIRGKKGRFGFEGGPMKKPPEVTDEELAAALLQMERDGKISIDVDGTVHLLTPEIEEQSK
jgi:hypothetical protein